MSATAPDTTPAAMLVPESSRYSPLQAIAAWHGRTLLGSSFFSPEPFGIAAMKRLPGARRSGFR